MPISIRFHESGKYLVGTYVAKVVAEELRRAYEDFYATNDVPINMPELVDLSTADLGGLTPTDLTTFARWAEDFLRNRGETARKAALLIPGLPGRSKLIIFEVLMQNSPNFTQTFSNREEAVRWLTDPTPASFVRKPTR